MPEKQLSKDSLVSEKNEIMKLFGVEIINNQSTR